MIELESLHATKIIYFKDASFNFEPGLTFIMGRNRQRVGQQASNGSGKSLFFGILPNLIFDAHPVIVKNARSVQKQLYGKGSKASLSFKSNAGNRYTYAKAGSKTELFRGKKNLKSRIARDTLRKLIDISEEEFFSTVYIDSSRPNNFMRGTSAERFQFVTNLFRLEDLDSLRKQFRKELNELKSDSILLERLLEDLKTAEQNVADLPEDAEQEAARLSAKLSATNDKIDATNGEILKHETWGKYQKALKELDALELPKRTLKECKVLLRAVQDHQAALDHYRQQLRRRKKLVAEFRECRVNKDVLNQHSEMVELQNRLHVLESDSSVSGGRHKPTPPEEDRTKAEAVAKSYSADKLRRMWDVQRSTVKSKQEVLEEFDSELGDSAECPTCHSVLTAKTKKSIRAVLQQNLAQAEKKLKKIGKIRDAVNVRDEWAEYDTLLERHKEFTALKAKIGGYPFEKVERYKELKTLLKSELPEKPETVDADEDQLTTDIAIWEKHAHLSRLADALKTDKPSITLDEAKAIKLKLSVLVNKIMKRLPRLQSQADLRKQALSRLNDLRKETGELGKRLEDLPVYEMLSDAYSSSGIKLLLVKRIATAIETNLNTFSKQTFSENFTFKINIEDGRFDIIVSRQSKNKGTIVSDVRHLSGAEGRLFQFLQLLSLLPLVPSGRRMNVMILDEPDANMDPETLETFRDVMLPLLAKVVPCLIVISPNPAVVVQHARVKTVVKENGVSRIVEGMV